MFCSDSWLFSLDSLHFGQALQAHDVWNLRISEFFVVVLLPIFYSKFAHLERRMWRTLSSMALEMTWKKIRCNPSQWNVPLSWIQRPKSCWGSSHELHSSLQPEVTLLWQSRANKKQCLLDMTSAEFENYKSELIWYCIRACLCSLGYTDRTIWNSFCAADCQLNASLMILMTPIRRV